MLEGMNIQGATELTHARAATLKALGAIALLSVQSPPIYSEQSTPDIHFGNINSFQENSMQPVPNQERQTAEAFAAHLALVGKDVQAWVDLFAENAIVEFPYASTTPGRLEGKEAIYNYMKDVPAQMQDLVFTNVRIYPTSNPNVLFAEVHGEAVIVSTGHHYQQDYVMRLETKEGKIIHYREYWNPIPALEAWGGTQNLRQSFNADSVA
jgi:ketosteroid isomerase-like protein